MAGTKKGFAEFLFSETKRSRESASVGFDAAQCNHTHQTQASQ
jgi:hypothetical protein